MSNSAAIPSPLSGDPFLRDVPEVDGFKTLDPAVLHSKLGQGGMGAVYRGRHLVLGIDVAVKCLLPSHGAADAQMQARFRREARIAAQLSHENLVRLYELRHAHGMSYLILELVEGETAHARVLRKGPLSEVEAATIVMCAARGLAKAHRHHEVIVHRDIKPANILISKRGEVKLADLGLAKAVDHVSETTFQTDGLLGTPPYMAPEQWDADAKASPQTDVWAMGATLYYLLTGRVALKGTTSHQIYNEAVNRPFPDPRVVRPDLSPELARIVRRCTRKEPEKRYADASALAKELQNFLRARAQVPDVREGEGPKTTVPDLLPPSDVSAPQAPALTQDIDARRDAAPLTKTSGIEHAEPPAVLEAQRSPKRLLAIGAAAIGAVALGVLIWLNVRVKSPSGWTVLDDTRVHGWAKRVRDPRSGIEFRLVPPGEFQMGSPPGEPDRDPDSEKQHRVRITRPFYLAETETTEAQWAAVMAPGTAPVRADFPKTGVSWAEARAFCQDIQCDLPTEAEWEYAARAGSKGRFWWGEEPRDGEHRGNFHDLAQDSGVEHTESRTFPFDDGCEWDAPAKSFAPNPWGFHNMLGNRFEWVRDGYRSDYERLDEVDPVHEEKSAEHIARGGGYLSEPGYCRSAYRYRVAGTADPMIGFRPARTLD